MTITIAINQTGAVRLSDNNEINTYVPRKEEHAMEFLEFLEENVPANCEFIKAVFSNTAPMHRVLDVISYAKKFGIELSAWTYDINKAPINFNQLDPNDRVEYFVRSVL